MTALSAPPSYVQQSFFPIEEPPAFSLNDWLDSLPPLPDFPAPSFDLSGLNDAQRTAVMHSGGPALVRSPGQAAAKPAR